MIPAIQWSPANRWSEAIRWSPAIWWSIGIVDFDNPKVYGDTFISDGLVYNNSMKIHLKNTSNSFWWCSPSFCLLLLKLTLPQKQFWVFLSLWNEPFGILSSVGQIFNVAANAMSFTWQESLDFPFYFSLLTPSFSGQWKPRYFEVWAVYQWQFNNKDIS